MLEDCHFRLIFVTHVSVTVTGGDASETQGRVSVPVSNVSGGSDARVSANVTREPGVITRLGGFSRLGRVGV